MSSSATCRRRHRCRRSSSGFTILEFLVVVAVFLIVAAITVPLTVKMMVRLRIEGFADQLAMMINRTRSQAVRENATYSIDWSGDAIVPSGPAISEAAVLLAADAHGLSRYNAAPCFDHNGDGTVDSVVPPLSFNGIGAPSALVAFCFADPPQANGEQNVMQVRIDSTAGVVKVAKLIDDSMVAAGERFADESTEKFEWIWH